MVHDLPFLLPFANLTTSLSHVVSEDVLCVMSTRVFDGKSRKAAYEVNQGNIYDIVKDKLLSLMLFLDMLFFGHVRK